MTGLPASARLARSLAGLLARFFSELALASIVLGLTLVTAIRTTPAPDMSRAQLRSQLVASSSGEILWGFLAQDEKWRLSTGAGDVDAKFMKVLIAYEDQRFWQHHGVDFVAMLRASYQALRYRHAVSGGSTLTMQVVRMLEPRPRTLGAKIDQVFKAIKLERILEKQRILDLYLTMAPFGGNVEGLRAATLLYLGKEPKQLSLAEAALLAAVPQAPEARRPDRFPDVARAARNRVLANLARRGAIADEPAGLAKREPLDVGWHALTRNAPHLSARLRQVEPSKETIPTLIDRNLQIQIERIAGRAIANWGDAVNIAVVVLRNRDASVAAYLGGVDYSAESRKGFVDTVQGVRSPGSTLKPFIYAMAFEKLIVHPETIITDQAIEIEGYRPENADGQFTGDISIRQALIRSRNTPAVMLLHKVGIDAFMTRFRTTGRPLLLPASSNAPGLAIALGGAGVTLEQLTWFYSVFANEGVLKTLRLKASDPVQSQGQFIAPAPARATADILADVPAPAGYARQRSLDEGRRLGFKTGTSHGFRDAWAIGFTQLHTVGVWVGRADGAAHLGAYGVTAAAPILMQIFDRLPVPRHDVAAGDADLGALTSLRELPARLARFDQLDRAQAARPLEISFPRNGASLRADRGEDGKVELPIAATGGRPPYQWTLSGVVQPSSPVTTSRWTIDGRGQFELSITDSAGSIARSSFWID
jgi:penicillin-binding protein 1C